MKAFTFRFYARRKGALGVSSEHTDTTCAETADDARLRLYETWEHIHACKLIREEEVAHGS